MNDDRLRTMVLDALTEVAPDIEARSVEPGSRFRDQFDFDSMDFLNFVIALHQRSGLDIPEADYPALSDLDGCVAYLRTHGVCR